MAIQTNDVYRGWIKWRFQNQRCMNTITARCTTFATGGVGVNQLLTGFTSRLSTFATNLATMVSDQVWFEEVGTSLVAGRGDLHSRVVNINHNGQVTGDPAPGLLAMPVYLNTDYGGRSRRGRFHWGGLSEDQISNGLLSNPVGADHATALLAELSTRFSLGSEFSQWKWSVFSRKLYNELPAGWVNTSPEFIATAVPVTALSTTGILGSMYSRRIGRGS